MIRDGFNRLGKFIFNYFAFSSQLVPQADAEQSIREDVSFRGTNLAILIMAILIASLGLNTNSTAVIIGAMLISPLMGPIIGIGLGVGIHDFELIKRALRNLLVAAGFSVVASTLFFLISPVSESHSELLARTSPTIYDVLIGFVGGGAGILAIGSRSKGNVIPGVAIATALMPPLCTAGYGLATGQFDYFIGALYLFLINSIYIAFATFIGVKLLGYKGVDTVNNQRARRVRMVVYIAAILTMLPSIWLTYRMIRTANFNARVASFVTSECNFGTDTQVLSDKVTGSGDTHTLTITLFGHVLNGDSLELALTPRLKFYGLEGTRLVFVQGGIANRADAGAETLRDVYTMAQTTILKQQHQIDSLQSIVNAVRQAQNAAAVVAPEVQVLFPTVKDVALTKTVFADVATLRTDTMHVALVANSEPMTESEQEKFRSYLERRLEIKNLIIVDVKNINYGKP